MLGYRVDDPLIEGAFLHASEEPLDARLNGSVHLGDVGVYVPRIHIRMFVSSADSLVASANWLAVASLISPPCTSRIAFSITCSLGLHLH